MHLAYVDGGEVDHEDVDDDGGSAGGSTSTSRNSTPSRSPSRNLRRRSSTRSVQEHIEDAKVSVVYVFFFEGEGGMGVPLENSGVFGAVSALQTPGRHGDGVTRAHRALNTTLC